MSPAVSPIWARLGRAKSLVDEVLRTAPPHALSPEELQLLSRIEKELEELLAVEVPSFP